MDIEGLFLVSDARYEVDDDSDLYAFVSRTPMTNCCEETINNLKKKIPKNIKCHGLVASRVSMKSEGERMYFISPIKTERWKPFVNVMTCLGYERQKGVSETMVKNRSVKLVNDFMKKIGWNEPKQHPPTRMCDVD